MVSKNFMQSYNCKSLEDFFKYIVNLRLNGNNIESLNLSKEMSVPQKKDFIDYLSLLDEDESLQVLMYEIKNFI